MTYAEFRKAYPATRCFQRYSPEARAGHASSHRVGARKRDAVGEFYYTHELKPSVGFPTAKLATTTAYAIFLAAAKLRIERQPIRIVCEADDVDQEEPLENEASELHAQRFDAGKPRR